MMYIPKQQAEKLNKLLQDRKGEFIKKAQNADPAFIIMMEAVYNNPDFENYPEKQKQITKDFIEARKL